MSDKTAIEWADATWNIITGCEVVSAGCTNCYAMHLAGADPKLRNHPSRAGLTREVNGKHVWTGEVRFNPQWLEDPLHWTRPRKIFVCAHGDLFHDAVKVEWLDLVFAVMAMARPGHVFEVLTKRPAGMRAYLEGLRGRAESIARNIMARWPNMSAEMVKALTLRLANWNDDPLPNVWLGVTAENQAMADERLGELLGCVAALHWVSYEPAVGPVDWRRVEPLYPAHRASGFKLDALAGVIVRPDGSTVCQANGRLDWLIAGGESGDGARPGHPEWFRVARDQCAACNVHFMFKQWGNWVHQPLPDGSAIEVPPLNDPKRRVIGIDGAGSMRSPCALMVRHANKRKAGNHLDGVQHLGAPPMPAPSQGLLGLGK